MENWLISTWPILFKTVGSVFLMFIVMIVLVRIGGLRTFAKMSSFDFASTIAIGSVLASVIMNTGTSIVEGSVALASIVFFQQVFAKIKISSDKAGKILENSPVLLMDGPNILEHNMKKTGVSRSDLIAKLREANVIQLTEVKAVVLETTGDISVLHESGDLELEDMLLEDATR